MSINCLINVWKSPSIFMAGLAKFIVRDLNINLSIYFIGSVWKVIIWLHLGRYERGEVALASVENSLEWVLEAPEVSATRQPCCPYSHRVK